MLATVTGTGNGTAPVVNLTFPYIDKTHVKASVDGGAVGFTWTGTSQVTFTQPVPVGSTYRVYRKTPTNPPVVDFTDASPLTATDLDRAETASNYRDEELEDLNASATAASLRVPEPSLPPLPPAPGRASRFMQWSSSGTVLETPSIDEMAAQLAAPIQALAPMVGKGDPGGNAASIGLFIAASALAIPAGVNSVRTSGYSEGGIGIADYVYDATVDSAYVAANPRTSFLDTAGRGFRLAVPGPLFIDQLGAKPDWDGTAGTDNRSAIQAAVDYANARGGGTVLVGPGTYYMSGSVRLYANVTLQGLGRRASWIATTHAGTIGATPDETARNGSAFYTDFGINSSVTAYVTLRDLTIRNTNAGNLGAGFYESGGTYISLERVTFDGFKYGVIFEQTELGDIDLCDFQVNHLAGVWLVNGNQLHPTASGGFTNRISINRSQFGMGAGAYGIVDDGGDNHSFTDNNYNSGITHIRVAGANDVQIRGGEYESASGPNIVMTAYSLSGAGVGGSVVSLIGGMFAATGGNPSIQVDSGNLSVDGMAFFSGSSGASAAIAGAGNLFRLYLGAYVNGTVGPVPTIDGTPTNLYDASAPPAVAGGSQFLIHDTRGTSYDAYVEKAFSSPYSILRIAQKGGAGGWSGAINLAFGHDTGAPVDLVSFESPDASHVNLNLTGGSYQVNGLQVVGARQGAIANDASGAANQATVNAILSALRAHGLIA